MPSDAHKFISNMIVMKMFQMNYEIVSFDGEHIYLKNTKIKAPPSLKRHRPDLIGFNSKSKKICIGEAKTKNDLNSSRTREQIEDYSSLITKSNKEVDFIIGVPISGIKKLNEILKKLELSNRSNITILKIPDRLLS